MLNSQELGPPKGQLDACDQNEHNGVDSDSGSPIGTAPPGLLPVAEEGDLAAADRGSGSWVMAPTSSDVVEDGSAPVFSPPASMEPESAQSTQDLVSCESGEPASAAISLQVSRTTVDAPPVVVAPPTADAISAESPPNDQMPLTLDSASARSIDGGALPAIGLGTAVFGGSLRGKRRKPGGRKLPGTRFPSTFAASSSGSGTTACGD